MTAINTLSLFFLIRLQLGEPFVLQGKVVNWTRKIFGWINIKPIFKETVFTIRSNKMWHLLFFYEHTNSDKIPALIINSTPDKGQQGYH